MNINFTISFPDGYFQTWQKGFLQMITFICLFSIDSNVQLLPVETISIFTLMANQAMLAQQ